MSELRKSSAPVLRVGAGVADEMLNIGEVPGFVPAQNGKLNSIKRNSSRISKNRRQRKRWITPFLSGSVFI